MVSAHARRGERLRAIGAQSRDRTTVVRNLGILRMRNAISRLRKFSDCVEHIRTFVPTSNLDCTSFKIQSIRSQHWPSRQEKVVIFVAYCLMTSLVTILG